MAPAPAAPCSLEPWRCQTRGIEPRSRQNIIGEECEDNKALDMGRFCAYVSLPSLCLGTNPAEEIISTKRSASTYNETSTVYLCAAFRSCRFGNRQNS